MKSILLIALFFVLFVGLAAYSALTRRPWSDEGWIASPAYNLATHGKMGTLVWEPLLASWLKDVDKYTFWTSPLHLVAQAAWYKFVGFGLFRLRALSIVFGLIALLSWFVIMKALSGGNSRVALFTVILLASDYVFVSAASFGRMDMMCAALGFAGLALYLQLRERHLTCAVLAGHVLVVASGLTHALGVLHFAALVFMMLYFDRRRLGWQHALLALLPYVIGAVGWGIYISNDPHLFVTQFFGNAGNSGRFNGFSAPLAAFKHEIVGRYLVAYGLGAHSVGHSGPIMLKSLILLVYIVAIIGSLCVAEIRRHPGYRALLITTALCFCILTLIDGQKLSYYLIQVVPFYTALSAVWLQWCWAERQVPRLLITLIVGGLIVLQVGGLLLRARNDPFHRSYLPATAFLKNHSTPATLVMGSAELGFELGFDSNLVDDFHLGYRSGKRPDFYVVDEIYGGAIEGLENFRPEIYRHIQQTLEKNYQVAYDHSFYKIYSRRDGEYNLK